MHSSAFSRPAALSSQPGAAPVSGSQLDYLQHMTRVTSFAKVQRVSMPVYHFSPVNTDNELEDELMTLTKQGCDTHRPSTPLPTSFKFRAAPRKRMRTVAERSADIKRARVARARLYDLC